MRFLSPLLLLLSLSTAVLSAAESDRPNILFAIADDWGWHAGAYGTPWIETPGFDRVAREGLLFRNAFTPNAKCAPSRAIILTGRHSWQLEQAGNHMAYFPAKFKSYPEALADSGYFVGVTGKGWGPGIANDADGKTRDIVGKGFNQRRAKPPAGGISQNDYANNFVDFLGANEDQQPWCFWYGATEPHRGYEYGAGVEKGGKELSDIDRVPNYWPDNDIVRNDMLDYAFEVEHVDNHLVRMLATLQQRGQLENTIVVVTSDHGMPFPRVKGQAYFDSNHIPLAIRWPKGIVKPGRTIDDFVSFIDLSATFLDLAGVSQEQSGMAEITGSSLRPILESDQEGQVIPERDHVLVGKERHDAGRPHDWGYPIRGIVTDRFLFLKNYKPDRWPAGNPETGYLNTDGSPTKTWILNAHREDADNRFWQLNFGKRSAEELYDLTVDSDCVNNLANESGYESQREELNEQMVGELKQQDDPRMLGNGDVFDQYRIASPGSRGFYDRWKAGENPAAGWVNRSDFETEPIE